MPKFEINWTEESWYRVVIEADTEEKALEKWGNSDYPEYDNLKAYGGEIQDGIDVEEVED